MIGLKTAIMKEPTSHNGSDQAGPKRNAPSTPHRMKLILTAWMRFLGPPQTLMMRPPTRKPIEPAERVIPRITELSPVFDRIIGVISGYPKPAWMFDAVKSRNIAVRLCRLRMYRNPYRVPFQKDKVIETADIRRVTAVNTFTTEGMKPTRKISGGNIGDVRTGWFRLESGEKAFLTLEGPRALYIETTLGFNALVGCDEFEEFEEAFAGLVFRQQGSE